MRTQSTEVPCSHAKHRAKSRQRAAMQTAWVPPAEVELQLRIHQQLVAVVEQREAGDQDIPRFRVGGQHAGA